MWGKSPIPFLFRWISIYPNAICWKDYHLYPLNCLGTLTENRLTIINIWVVVAIFLSQCSCSRSPESNFWLTQWPCLLSLCMHGPHFPAGAEFRPPAPLSHSELKRCATTLYFVLSVFTFSFNINTYFVSWYLFWLNKNIIYLFIHLISI